MIRRAERAHRLATQRTSRLERHQADGADSTSRFQQRQERQMVTRYSLTAPGWRRSLMVYAAWGCASVNAATKASVMTW
jgi:hypothetical protein